MEYFTVDNFDKFTIGFLTTVVVIFLAETLFEIVKRRKSRKRPNFLKGNVIHWLLTLSMVFFFMLEIAEQLMFGDLHKLRFSSCVLSLAAVLLSSLSYHFSQKRSHCTIHLIGFLALWIFFGSVYFLKINDRIKSSRWQNCPVEVRLLIEISILTNSILLYVIDLISLCSKKLSKYRQANQFTEDAEFVHAYSSFLSKVTYHWANKILWKGFRRPLDLQDLGTIPSHEDVEIYYQKLKREIQREKEMSWQKNRHFSMWRCMWFVSKESLVFTAVLQFFSVMAMLMSPLFLDGIIASLERSDSSKKNFSGNATSAKPSTECAGAGRSVRDYVDDPYVLTILMIAVYLLQVMMRKYHDFAISLEAVRLRAAIQACVFDKSLSLKMMHVNEGKFINHMAIDSMQMIDFSTCIHSLWSLPILVTMCLLLLIFQLGKPGGIGCVIIFVLVPLQYYIGKYLGHKQDKIMDIADERLLTTNEMLDNIKLLKMYSWENFFGQRVVDIRSKELSVMWKTSIARVCAALITDGIPSFACLITFILCFYMENFDLTLSKVFSCTVVFLILANELFFLIITMVTFVKTRTSMDRLGEYFSLPQIQQQKKSRHEEEKPAKKAQKKGNMVALIAEETPAAKETPTEKETEGAAEEERSKTTVFKISNGTFTWHHNPVLIDVDFSLPKGKLTILLGPVGSGKSSLLWALLGEMEKVKGDQELCELPAVMVPQRAWIQNATIRENIVFGQKYDKGFYDEVVRSCALNTDFDILQDGDATEIGEKGANLSGGQKQRIGLARAIYQDAQVYLMDDTLSALDPHVASTIFESVVLDRLIRRNKTVLLVTHNSGLLRHCQNIVVMSSGRIAFHGPPDKLPPSLKSSLDSEQGSPAAKNVHIPKVKPLTIMPERLKLSSMALMTMPAVQENQTEEEDKEEPLKLVLEEERQMGSTPLYYPLQYVKFAGPHLMILSLLFYGFRVGFKIVGDFYLGLFIENSEVGNLDVDRLTLFCVFTCASIILIPVGVIDVEWYCLKASRNIHSKIIGSFAAAPMRFFDTTPVGRILNRMSADLNIIDLTLNSTFDCLLFLLTFVVGSIALNCLVNPVFLVPIVPILLLSLLIQRFFIASCRELQRLDCITKSYILAHFSQVLSGLHIIRMSRCQEKFQKENFKHINKNTLALLFQHTSNSWMAIRQDLLGGVILCASCFCSLRGHHDGYLNTNDAAVAMLYAVCNSSFMFWIMRYLSNVEILSSNVQRLVEYCDLKGEGSDEDKKPHPPADWPKTGNIEFKDVCLTYDMSLKPVIEKLNLKFESGHKVGICGRTGSGKSTLTLGIFRLVEACNGQIFLDGLDISSVPVKDLRERLAIIPQEPVIFSGSIRFNLDPHSSKADNELWSSLEVSQLKEVIANMPQKLDTHVSSNRCSLSLGERQLLCLARALVRNSKVLVMDEATASIDEATDRIIQKIIKSAFEGRTVITIAHRISTIIDADQVVVMQAGRMIESGRPNELLAGKTTFASMANSK